jgi:membrane protease YdiL (CAAX protease family)
MLSEKPWKLDLVLMLVAGLLISLSAGTMLGILFEQAFPKQSSANGKFYHFLISFISFQGTALVLAHYFLKKHHLGWVEFLGLTSPRWKAFVALGALVGILSVPVALSLNKLMAWLMSLIQMEAVEQPTIKVLKLTVGPIQRICFGITAIVIAPVVEESLFRGILYPIIKQRTSPMIAVSITSLLFAAIHGNIMTFVPLTFFAVILTLLYEKTDTLLAPIVSHSIFNSANFVIFIFSPN